VSRLGFLKGVKSLIAFLTALPLRGADLDSAAKSFYALPIVSVVEGLLVSVMTIPLALYSSPWLASIAFLAIHVAITRGLHIDGLADYADAVGSLRTGEEALRIMKDPRKGAFAVMAICIYVATIIVSSSSIFSTVTSARKLVGAILSLYLWSLESMYLVAAMSAPEPYQGLGRKFVESAKIVSNGVKNAVLVAAIQALCFWLCGPLSLVPIATSLATSALVSRDCMKRLGFANGDVLGASNELSRATSIFALAVVAKWIY